MADLKKSLLAMAALSVFSGTASAQSSITIYGVVDIGYFNEKSREPGSNANSQANASAIIYSAQQISRLGFKETKDFGGGIIAFFTAETDVGTTNNMSGSAVFPVYSIYSSSLTSGNSYYSGNVGVGNVSDAFTVRTQSALSAQSANFGGFKVAGLYTLRNDTIKGNSKNAPVQISNNYNGWGLSADYTWQKLYIGIAYQALNSSNLGYGCDVPGECASTVHAPQAKGWTATSVDSLIILSYQISDAST